jgi:ketosteroid isomerase-like protein
MAMTADQIDRPDVVAEITSVFEAYEAALKRNDAAALNEFFWDDPRALRYGISEHNLGIDEIRRWRNAAPAVPVSRRLRGTLIVTFGADWASVSTEFATDDTPTLGRQTQIWVRFHTGWRIVAAHVSVIDGVNNALTADAPAP